MSMTPQPLDEVDDTENMMHQQCHVTMQTPPYRTDIMYPYNIYNRCRYHFVTSHDTA
jgi:hypothetical protein